MSNPKIYDLVQAAIGAVLLVTGAAMIGGWGAALLAAGAALWLNVRDTR